MKILKVGWKRGTEVATKSSKRESVCSGVEW